MYNILKIYGFSLKLRWATQVNHILLKFWIIEQDLSVIILVNDDDSMFKKWCENFLIFIFVIFVLVLVLFEFELCLYINLTICTFIDLNWILYCLLFLHTLKLSSGGGGGNKLASIQCIVEWGTGRGIVLESFNHCILLVYL